MLPADIQHIIKVAEFRGTLPPELLEAIIAQSPLTYLATLAYRFDLTVAHTAAICARFTDAARDVPPHVLRAHIRACGPTPQMESTISTAFTASSSSHRADIAKRLAEELLGELTITQTHYLLTQGTDALTIAIYALHGNGVASDLLTAILRARELLNATLTDPTLSPRTRSLTAYTIERAVVRLRAESLWHAARAFCSAQSEVAVDEVHLDRSDVTDDELAHGVHLSLIPYLATDVDCSWAIPLIEKQGPRMQPADLDAVQASPHVTADLHAAIDAAREQHAAATALSASTSTNDTPIGTWLRALGPLTPAQWSTALIVLGALGNEASTHDAAGAALGALAGVTA